MTWVCQGKRGKCGHTADERKVQKWDANLGVAPCWSCSGGRLTPHRWVGVQGGATRSLHPPSTPAVARRTDPSTSWAAAASVENIRESQQLIFDILHQNGSATDEQIWSQILELELEHRTSPSGARTRRSELVEMGLVRDSGERLKMSTGRMAIVWEIATR